MPGRNLGDAYIVISPETAGFRTMTESAVDKAVKSMNPQVKVGADTTPATAAIAGLQTRLTALSKGVSNLQVKADTKQAIASVSAMQAKMLALAKSVSALNISADTTDLDAKIAAEQAKVAKFQLQLSKLQVNADTTAAAAKIAGLQKAITDLRDRMAKMDSNIDITAAESKILALQAELKVLGSNAKAVTLAANTNSINASINATMARITALKKDASEIELGDIDPAKIVAAEAGLAMLEATFDTLKEKIPGTEDSLVSLGDAAKKSSTSSAFSWSILTKDVVLFGGVLDGILPKALAQVSVWHILADSAIEFTAILVPAAVAFGAFAVAGEKAGNEVYQRFLALNTVTNATGMTLPQLGNSFSKLSDSVRPQVYQLAGEAMVYMQHSTGGFQLVAQATGKVVDDLGARFVYATTQGQGVGKFMQGAAADAANLGDLIGNMGGILGNVMKAVPGYAEILLKFGDGFTHVLETITGATIPVLNFALALHGAVLWLGLGTTATLAFVGGVAKMIKNLLTFGSGAILSGVGALKDFATYLATGALAAVRYGAALVTLAADEGIAAAAGQALTDVPMVVWITLAAAAIGGLVYLMLQGDKASQQFVAGVSQAIQGAKLSDVLTTIQDAQAATATKLAGAQANLATQTTLAQEAAAGASGPFASVSTTLTNAASAVETYTAAQNDLKNQYSVVSSRISDLSGEYGSNAAALGALNAAGITTAQLTDTNNEHWAQAQIEIEATTQAYAAMGTQTGQLGNDLDVMGRTMTTQYTAVQKLNQAWSAFIADVTGSQDAFDAVAQGFETLDNANVAVTVSLGKLKYKFDDTKASVDDLTPAGVALNQAFTAQVSNTEKLAETWSTAGIQGGQFKDSLAAGIAPLEKYAQGSQEATAQLVALGEMAGYQGPISLDKLNEFLGITSEQLKNTSGDTQKLKQATDEATQQEALLTGAMKGQGDYIAQTLLNDINQATLKYGGVTKAAQDYGAAIAQDGQDSDAAKGAREDLIQNLIDSGRAAKQSQDQIAAMIAKVLGIPVSQALTIVMNGEGQFKIVGNALVDTSANNGGGAAVQQGSGGGPHVQSAAGGYIGVGTGPTADDVHAMLSKGEYVVKASAVQKYGVGTMDAINAGKYASGGLVQTGNASVLSGQFAVSTDTRFNTDMATQMKAEMNASAKLAASVAAANAAKAAANVGSSGGGGAGQWAGTVSSVLSQLGLPSSDAGTILSQISTESGGNATIVNKSDSNWAAGTPSVGLMQVIGPTFDSYAGKYRNTGPFEYGVSVNPEANVFSGTNYAVNRYGNPGFLGVLGHGHGYALGGLVGGPGFGGEGTRFARAAGSGFTGGGGLTRRMTSLARLLGVLSGFGLLGGHGGTGGGAAGGDGSGGFGLTRADLGLPASLPSDTGSTAADSTDTSTSASTSTTSTSTVNNGIKDTAAGKTWLAAYAKAQATELAAYYAFAGAFANSLPKAAKGSWLAKHKTGITSELKTLKNRQSLEEAAYDAVTRSGAQSKYNSHYSTTLRNLGTVLADQDLAYTGKGGQPALRRKLTADTGALATLMAHVPAAPAGSASSSSSSTGSTTTASTAATAAGKAWAAAYMKAQNSEYGDYGRFSGDYAKSLPKAAKGSWLYSHKAGITSELKTLASRQSAEEAAYDAVLQSGAGSSHVSHFGTMLSSLITTLGDQDLAYSGAGGQRHDWQNLSGQAAYLSSLAKHIPAGVPVTHLANGGLISEPVTGIGASGQFYQFGERGPETVTPGTGGGGNADVVAELRALRAAVGGLANVAAAAPRATGQHVGAAINGATGSAVFRGRYPRGG